MAVDAPFHTIVFGIPFPRLDPAFGLDQIIEAALLAPTARIDPNRPNPHLVGQVNAANGVVNVLLPFGSVLPHKVLMDAQIVHVQAEAEGVAL